MPSEKLTETYTLRITPALKEMVEALDTEQKHDLNHRLRIEIARAVHNSKFDAAVYLSEEKA